MSRFIRAVLWAALATVLVGACSSGPQPVAIQSGSPGPTLPASDTPGPSGTPYTAPSDVPSPVPLTPGASDEPTATPGTSVPPGTTPFPTPGVTITPGSTRVIGTIHRADGSPASGICVVLEKGICPIATDDQGTWFTDIPAGPINWNFLYRIDGRDVGRQSVAGTTPGELRLPVFTLSP